MSEKYNQKVKELLAEGYTQHQAAELASGKLPADIRYWPPGPRYKLAYYEKRGMARSEAVAKVRTWVKEWHDKVID